MRTVWKVWYSSGKICILKQMKEVIKMSENAILLILGILFIMAFLGLAAILCKVCEIFFSTQIERLMNWLDIPTDEEWEEP